MGASPQLDVTQEDSDEHTRLISLRGELDVRTAPALAELLRKASYTGKTAIAIDLGELTFMDSTGLMVLLNGLRRVIRQGGRLAIACTNPTVLRLFEITGTESTFTIVDSRTAAFTYLRDDWTAAS